jgi:hypothetical protein
VNAVSYPIAADDIVAEAPHAHVDPFAAEHNRWMLAMGLPLLMAAAFVGAALTTGHAWLMAPAIVFLGVMICILPWLAMSSCTLSDND